MDVPNEFKFIHVSVYQYYINIDNKSMANKHLSKMKKAYSFWKA